MGKRLSIRRRFSLLLTLGTALSLVAVVVSFWVMQYLVSVEDGLTRDLMRRESLLFRLLDDVREGQNKVQALIREKDADVIERMVEELRARNRATREHVREAAAGAQVETRIEDLQRLEESVVEDVLKGNGALALQRFAEDTSAAAAATSAAVGKVREELYVSASQAREKAQARASSMKTGLLVTLVLGVVGFWVFGVTISRGVARSLDGTAAMLRDMAEGQGDLTKRLDDQRGDELGWLGKWFNAFAEKIRKLVASLAETSGTVSSASEELSATAASLAVGSESTREKASVVAEAAERHAGVLDTAAREAADMASAMREVSHAMSEMTEQVGSMAESCRRELAISTEADEKARSVRANMERLGASALEIGKVVDLIQSIAKQTNLLALNATIQAASAGAAGKTFVVVADEIKVLAHQTADATEQIRSGVRDMQSNAEVATKSTVGIANSISEMHVISGTIAESVAQQSQTFEAISGHVERADRAATAIAGRVTDVAGGIGEMTSAVGGMSEAAEQSAQQSREIRKAADDLARLAAQVDLLVRQFKI